MFLAISDTVFINTDYVSSMAIEEHFTEEGEKWFVRMYGKFDVPEEARERDGSIIVGPFDTKQAAFHFIKPPREDPSPFRGRDESGGSSLFQVCGII